MATKKKAANPEVKTLVTAMKKTISFNTVLPILEDVLFLKGEAICTDLETFVHVPYKLKGVPDFGVCCPAKLYQDVLEMGEVSSLKVDNNFGVTVVSDKREVKFMGENPDNYPKWPEQDESFKHIATFGEKEIEDIKVALCFVSNDDLRPAMTGIYFHKTGKKSYIVATDAHRLFWRKISSVEQNFILPAKTAKILLALGGEEWKVYGDGGEATTNVIFINEAGVKITARVIDARFPDYKVVIPTGDAYVNLTVNDKALFLKELKNASKFANRSTNQVVFGMNGEFSLQSQDVDFSFEYYNSFPNKDAFEFSFNTDRPKILRLKESKAEVKVVIDNGPIVRVKRKDSFEEPFDIERSKLEEYQSEELHIAFNGKFIEEVVAKLGKDEPVKMKLWTSTKCTIINDRFLVMPLMLNQ